MTLESIINSIRNAPSERRDLLLDELNDYIEAYNFKEEELEEVIDFLSGIVKFDGDSSEQESFFNILSSLYLSDRCCSKVEEVVLSRMQYLNVSSLVHALEIVAHSKLANKRELLETFIQHDSEFIQNFVKAFLAQ